MRRFGFTPLRGGIILGLATLLFLGHYYFGEPSVISLSSRRYETQLVEPLYDVVDLESRHIDDATDQAVLVLDEPVAIPIRIPDIASTIPVDTPSSEDKCPDTKDMITREQQRALLSQAYADERNRWLDGTKFNPIKMASDIRAPQVFEPSMELYVSRLRAFVDEYFDGLECRVHLDRMLDNLEQHISPPLYREEPMRKVIVSSAKGGMEGVDMKLFPAWEEKLGPVGWTVEVADDEMTENWFGNFTKGDGRATGKWREVWDGMRTPVLKSDMIRYVVLVVRSELRCSPYAYMLMTIRRLMAMLIWGGIYSDSDTRPRSHPYIWGNGYTSITPPSLRPLGELLNGVHRDPMSLPSFIPQSTHMNATKPSYADEYEGINMPDIGLVTSIEYDGLIKGYGTNGIFAREMQVMQSTMMVSPSQFISSQSPTLAHTTC